MSEKTAGSDQNRQRSIDRKKFIQYSAAAVGGMVLGANRLTGSVIQPRSTDVINVALLGAGAQGQILLNSCLKIPGIRITAVCDIWEAYNRRRVSRLLQKYRHEHRVYEDYRELLASEKDLHGVIIATPDFWHADHTVAALESGLDVYCEKEMSNTLEGARRMVEAADRTGRLLQIGHQRRSNPRYLHCYNHLIRDAKLFGRFTTVNGQWNRSVQPDLGWPKKAAMESAFLNKYGFADMHQFRNWRWFKGLGGGPVVDLGSHQIDIYNWFLEAQPVSVTAVGGIDYYDRKSHEWYDNVQALYEYKTRLGTVRAFYQVITTNRNGGYFETFMGDEGTLHISESAGRCSVYREDHAPFWDKWVQKGYLNAPIESATPEGVVLDVRETLAPPSFSLPVQLTDPYHMPHLENFFEAIRGNAQLNCPAKAGYETAVTVLKANEAVAREKKVLFAAEEFHI
jgi:predicted dehydrogenase